MGALLAFVAALQLEGDTHNTKSTANDIGTLPQRR
jgi:hypothetical protein